MRWRKLGRIFAPAGQHDWLVSHASVPVADHLEGDVYRLYFSGRDQHNRSQTGFLDLDITRPHETISVGSQPILTFGNRGEFDDAGAMGSWIVNDGLKKHFYYIGWNLNVSTPFRNAMGLAISADNGQTYIKLSNGPIIDRGIYDPIFVASSCVLLEESIWRMWYLSCIRWQTNAHQGQHFYHIKYAESLNGIEWNRRGVVCIDSMSPDEYAISRPCVIKDGALYKMWYSYRGIRYRIGYAESQDGVNWQRADHKVGISTSESGWDSDMIEYPYVFDHRGQRYMLYNGNGYGQSGIGLAVLDSD